MWGGWIGECLVWILWIKRIVRDGRRSFLGRRAFGACFMKRFVMVSDTYMRFISGRLMYGDNFTNRSKGFLSWEGRDSRKCRYDDELAPVSISGELMERRFGMEEFEFFPLGVFNRVLGLDSKGTIAPKLLGRMTAPKSNRHVF